MNLKSFHQEVSVERLNNGLEVIFCNDKSSPVAAIQLWCKTGSIHEGKWLGAGLSHVLEHMLFKGTTTRSGTEIDHLIQDAGGYFNAYTSFDRTVYHVTLPSEGTDIAIDVLSDIGLNATLPDDELKTELDVIRREMEMGNDDPSRRSSRRLFETAYIKSPYKHTVIGYRDIFDQLDRNSINEYYQNRYAPNNCFFVVSGDIEKDNVLSLINDKYSNYPMRPLPSVLIESEPRQISARERIENAPFEHAHFHYSWHIPDIRHDDIPTLDVLSVLLGSGRSSRLFREVRDRKALVHTADSWTFSSENAGMFGMSAQSDPAQLAKARENMLRELDFFKENLVSEDELSKAIKQFTAGNLSTLRTVQGQAGDLGGNWLYANDLKFSWRHLEAVQNITPEMLLAVANKYLTKNNSTLYALTPDKKIKSNSVINAFSKNNEIKKIELPNGLRLLLREDSSLPFTHFRYGSRSGVLSENLKNNGITRLMSKVMLKGTNSLSADDIARKIESAGGSIQAFSGNNSHGLNLDILSGDAKLGQEIFLDVIHSPAFDEGEINREKKSQLAAINQQRDHLLSHTMRQSRNLLYGDLCYGLDPLGKSNVLSVLTKRELKDYYESITAPKNSVISIFGDIDAAKIEDGVLAATHTWNRSYQLTKIPEIDSINSVKRNIEQTNKEQSVVTVAFYGAALGQADQTGLDLISEALSDMGSRLFSRIREELGLAYYVGAQNFSGIGTGCFTFYAGTGADSAKQVEEELIAQAKALSLEGLTKEELHRAKAKLLGQRKIARQELGSVAFNACMDELLGLGFNHSIDEEERIKNITLDQVLDVSGRFFSINNYAVAISTPSS